MKKLVICVLLVTVMSNVGCVSYQAIQHAKQKIALRTAIQNNDEEALMSSNIATNVTAWEAIKEEPVMSAGAFIADALIVWGGREGVKWMMDEFKDSGSDKASNNRNTTVNVSNSDNVNIEVNGDSTTTTTTTTTDNSDRSDNRSE